MLDLNAIQSALREFGCDGWLLYDFRGSNVLAQRVLGLTPQMVGSRRYLYCIPVDGPPRKLVHRIETGALDHLPGEATVYLRWQELEAGIAQLVAGMKTVAMEYSAGVSNPYIAKVDGGTVEFVRSLGVDVLPSGDLIQLFEATLDDEQWQSHLEASTHTNSAYAAAWGFIAEQVRTRGSVEENAVREVIVQHFQRNGMTTYSPPIVAVNANSGNPHYETGEGAETAIREGDFVLIDLWAKMDRPRSVYSDLTRVGYVGNSVPDQYTEIFRIVAGARDAAIRVVRDAFGIGDPLQGWQVDQAARKVIDMAGYGDCFIHRTGHSIGQEVHGNGANMDDLETHETRRVLPRTLFSVEPGIYLAEFGIRSEVDVFVDAKGQVHVTGGEPQTAVLPVLAAY